MQRKTAFKTVLACGCAAAAIGAGGSAFAADATAATNQLQEVVVTAQRRAERLEDVPMTVTALTSQAVESRGVRSVQDLTQVVSGVQINFQGSFTFASVRGVTALANGFGVESNVALYIDGYYQPDNVGLNADLGNVESLQVLKGPQGALYGRNATGGAILITSLQPTKTLTGKFQAQYGTYNDRSLTGYISGPISDRVRYSLSAYGRKTDGYYDLLDANGQKIGHAAPIYNVNARAKLQIDVTENLTATFGANFIQYKDGRGSMFTNEAYRFLLPPKVGRLYDPRTFATNRDTKQIIILNEGTMTLGYDTPIGKITSYTGMALRRVRGNFDFDGSWTDLSFTGARYREQSFQQGLDYNITAIQNLDLIVGGNYWYDWVKADPNDAYSGNRLSSRAVVNGKSKAWALFFDGTYHVTDKIVLNIGGRYTEERKLSRNASILYTAAAPGGVYSSPPITGARAKFTNFSPRAAIRYELEPGSNLYASVSKGFRSGSIQTVATATAFTIIPIQPEKITAYEVGYKTARSWVQFDVAGFYYDYKNIVVGITIPNPLVPTAPINLFSNAAKAEIYGIDTQATFRPIDHLEITVGATYLHARYKDFPRATSNGFNATTGLNVPSQIQNLSGYQMARAPDWSATLAASYEFVDVAGGKLLASANLKYTDSYTPNNFALYGNTPEDVARGTVIVNGAPVTYVNLAGALGGQQRYREGAYSLVNASLTWTDAEDRFSVGVWGNNLFNVKYHLSRNGSTFGDYGAWAWPRQVGVRAGYKF